MNSYVVEKVHNRQMHRVVERRGEERGGQVIGLKNYQHIGDPVNQ